jgi:hypothetical protein
MDAGVYLPSKRSVKPATARGGVSLRLRQIQGLVMNFVAIEARVKKSNPFPMVFVRPLSDITTNRQCLSAGLCGTLGTFFFLLAG